jgi:zinc transporter 9
MEPSLHEITWQVWAVLAFSFIADGYVLARTVSDIRDGMPNNYNGSFFAYVRKIRDPATLAVVLEDGAACLGIVIATAGIAAASSTGMPVFDGIAGLAISGLLASMGLVLVRINQRFLLGQAVDSEITNGIERILLSQRSIDAVYSVQSQWTGPDSFSFKAEVDFDGTYLAAMLMPKYEQEFLKVGDKLDQELRVLLSWYAEDVMRSVEREVRHVEAAIRKSYPGAEFIELEPMSKDADQFAIDDGVRAQLKRVEIEALNRYLRSLYVSKKKGKPDEANPDDDGSESPKQ